MLAMLSAGPILASLIQIRIVANPPATWEPRLTLSPISPTSAGWPAHWPAAENVRVHVVNRLAGLRPGVEHHPVPGLGHARAGRDQGRLRCKLVKQAITGLGERRQVRMVLSRDNQHVHRRLRVYVLERDGARALQHARRRDLPRRDATKQAVNHDADLNLCHADRAADIYGCTTAKPRRTIPLVHSPVNAGLRVVRCDIRGGRGDANSVRIMGVGAVGSFKPRGAWLVGVKTRHDGK
jgi:hypothetical protein